MYSYRVIRTYVMLVLLGFFIFTFTGSVLGTPEECTTEEVTDICNDRHAVFKRCPNPCPPTCFDRRGHRPCKKKCVHKGCECAKGYILSEIGGKCIRPKDCKAYKKCHGDRNATWTECTSACPLTCTSHDPTEPCPAICNPPGCQCKPGYVLNEKSGRCIKPKDCPKEGHCGRNATWTDCTSACPRTCDNKDENLPCPAICNPPGCECKRGYVLDKSNGRCIKPKDCPPQKGCHGDRNATWTDCTSACPLTCDNQNPNQPCPAICNPPGCECKPGYVLNEKSGQCIKPKDCPPPKECHCGRNATWTDCTSACPLTCENQDENLPCPAICNPPGCECKRGYVLDESSGRCIKPKDCPPQKGCHGDRNATWTDCTSACPLTCDDQDANQPCPDICNPPGCQCKPGYVLDKTCGLCIKPKDCPPQKGCHGDRNATWTDCTSACPLTCDNQNPNQPCPAICNPPGCECKPGYVLNEKSGQCIKPKDCPPPKECHCGRNATWTDCTSACPLTCENQDENLPCPAICNPPGCECKRGYVLDESSGRCIKPKDCPPRIGCHGDCNATWTDCTSPCPRTCANPDPNQNCIRKCDPPGCECNQGYVLDEGSGQCIKPEDCPPQKSCNGDPNASIQPCPRCPLTCTNQDPNQPCLTICDPPCCVCNPGYVLDESIGLCVKPEYCPTDEGCYGDPNASMQECPRCPLTCTNQDPNQPCLAICDPPGCVCNPGYVLDENNGRCVKPEDCSPLPGCRGDRNATFHNCPSACPLTCTNPEVFICIDMCMPPGCVCKEGFLLDENTGLCIRPEDCPGGSPTCGCNQTYVPCKVHCPTDECPHDDSRVPPPCDPMHPCHGGCICLEGYLRLNYPDSDCILASDCPPVKCTRPNEVWNPNPTNCLRERCEDMNIPCEFPSPIRPRCVCKPGYYRNKFDVCVPASECHEPPTCGKNEVYVHCKIDCPTDFCPQDDALVYPICDPMYPCPDGCVCQEGYLRLNHEDQRCILASKCPPVECTRPNEVWNPSPSDSLQEGCDNTSIPFYIPKRPKCVCKEGYLRNQDYICVPASECPEQQCSDPNAEFSTCPSACPGTCTEPDSDRPCIKKCMPPGCVCKPGFLLDNTTGLCVTAEECPGGSPVCGVNKTYSHCKFNCPTNYCPKDDCEMPVCDEPNPCYGGCVCKPGYLLLSEEDERCVLYSDCPPVKCTRPHEVWDPNPDNCLRERCDNMHEPCDFPFPVPPKCVCKKNYYRNQDGICVRASECPEQQCSDPNAEFSTCPSACPVTCTEPDSDRPCIKKCMPPGCVCKPGFLLDNTTGLCVTAEECPGGSPVCGVNKTYSHCKFNCPTNYCPKDDCEMPVCDEPNPCYGGCVCKPGYLLLSEEDERCVLYSDCPPVKCTRPHEVWDPNPDNCLRERCDNMHEPCDFPFPVPPKCVCKKNYYRNQDGICVRASECPEQQCSDPNAEFSTCPSACPVTCTEPDSDRPCIKKCMPPGCVCKPGFLLDETTGLCVTAEECPGGSPVCGVNETYSHCKFNCPTNYCPKDDCEMPVCDEPNPCYGGCVCKPGYLLLSEEDERCVLYSECPPVKCTRPHEVWDPNPNNCLRERCDNMHEPCDFPFPVPPKCVCKKNYYRNQDGICVRESECPEQQCSDLNAEFSTCPSACPVTCTEPDEDRQCIEKCMPPGCVCKSGFLLDTTTGLCVTAGECPGGSPECGVNKTYFYCKDYCPSNYCTEDDSLGTIECDEPDPCYAGCVCKPGYLMLSVEDERCVLNSDCPPVKCTRPNEVWDPNPNNCLRERCDDMNIPCDFPFPVPPKCVCKEGFFRNKKNICVPASECPQQICGYNEIAVRCKTICPPQKCKITYIDLYCYGKPNICEPGCDCFPDYLRNGCGVCIPSYSCPYPASMPMCGINEIAKQCKRLCPPQTCESKNILYDCPSNEPCEPGCDCINNYLRDFNGICVPQEECAEPCPISEDCKRTCTMPNRPDCPYMPSKINIDGCICKEGYILSEVGGPCIEITDCPNNLGCNGDPHARTTVCPQPCPSTCDTPDAINCYKLCEPIGCECDAGYLLSNLTGKCIKPEQCPCGNPCGKHAHFVPCKVECPSDFCPEDDSRDTVACDPPNPCLSGCVCTANRKRLSVEDPRCVKSYNCPPVVCTRPNEEWCPCPPECLAEDCEDRDNQQTRCYASGANCEPACICKQNYFRNENDICVHAKDCPCN